MVPLVRQKPSRPAPSFQESSLSPSFIKTLTAVAPIPHRSSPNLLLLRTLISSHSLMASIDVVTASFAASLALGGGGSAPDIGKIGGGPVLRLT